MTEYSGDKDAIDFYLLVQGVIVTPTINQCGSYNVGPCGGGGGG
jgi:hypothetical protein